ncbi:Bna1p [Malassezia vespertilionis]|uniref:Bna1p n=1 Tax=Malassezia vespertilionis TaxID=2020962 RepID=A0A2N1JER3_9BASI|nr:Bna1p [Malassezia vespertilionis]
MSPSDGWPTEELFYQAKGHMHLRIVDEGKFRTIEIKEGEYFLLPANTLHSPKRFADTIGLVLERTRERDQVHWFCPNLKAHDDKPFMIYCDEFLTKDLFEHLPKLLKHWASSEELRLCRDCGYQAAPLESPECPLV